MGWIEFFAAVIGALSWPLALVVLALLFRRQLAAKIGDIEEASLSPEGAGVKFIRKHILGAEALTDATPAGGFASGDQGDSTYDDSTYDEQGGLIDELPVDEPLPPGLARQRGYAEEWEAPRVAGGEALNHMLNGAERLAEQRPAESIDAAFDALCATVLSLAQAKDPHISPKVPIIGALETLGVPKGVVEAVRELENARDQALSSAQDVQKEDALAYISVVWKLFAKITTYLTTYQTTEEDPTQGVG